VYIGTTQDITERMRLDNVLRQDEERFRILSEINSLLLTSKQWALNSNFLNNTVISHLPSE